MPASGRLPRWVLPATVGGTIAASVAVHAIVDRPPVPACSGAAAFEAAVDREPALAAVAAVPVPYAGDAAAAVAESLDRHARRWAAQYNAACRRRGGGQGDAVMRCLGRGLAEVQATLSALEGVDVASVASATDPIDQLSPPPGCATQGDDNLAPAADALRMSLARARGLAAAGDVDEAEAVAAQVLADAGAWPWVAVEARLRLGVAAEQRGEWEVARRRLEEAYALAREEGHDAAAVEAATRLGSIVGYRLGDREAAEMWFDRAATDDAEARATLLHHVGIGQRSRGEYVKAVSSFREAEELRRSAVGGADGLSLADAEAAGQVLLEMGHVDDGIAALEVCLRAQQQRLGARHPVVADLASELGVALQSVRRFDEAARHLEGALAIREVALGPEHRLVGRAHAELGALAEARNRPAEAVAHHRRALEILEGHLGAGHPDLAEVLDDLARAQQRQGDRAGARESLERALAIRVEALGQQHTKVMMNRRALERLSAMED